MPRLQDTVPGYPRRTRKRRPNPLLLIPLHFTPEFTGGGRVAVEIAAVIQHRPPGSGTAAPAATSPCITAGLVEVACGEILPSVRLFLQKGGNGPRAGGQHSFRARESKSLPESFFFVASTETPALLEKRNYLIHEGLKTLGIHIHKQVEAVGSTLVDPFLHKIDDLLGCADEPIMSAATAGDNLTNRDGSVLKQAVSRCPVSGRYAGRPLLELRAFRFRQEMFRERLVGVEIRRIDIEPRSDRLDTGAACREFGERAEASKSFRFRAADHQRQPRQDGEMPRIAPMLPRAVFDIGVVSDRVFKSSLYREDDLSNAGRKVAPLRRTPRLH